MVLTEVIAEKEHPVNDPIKTRADGSIDTAHYISRGRIARSQAAHDMARTALSGRTGRTRAPRSWLLPLAILLAGILSVPYLA